MNPATSIRFRLALPADQYLAYYQLRARDVLVRAEDGRSAKFPADKLRPFVSHEGVYGLFELCFDMNNKFTSLERIAD